jgi:hypothetical protein
MLNLLKYFLGAQTLLAVVPAAVMLGGCTSPTTLLTSANPSRAPASEWADYQGLPTQVHGVAPGFSKADLSSLFPAYHPPQYAALGALPAADTQRRMVLFVNPAFAPAQSQLCDGAPHFPRGEQNGVSADVVGALCDGTHLITTASAKILTKNESPTELAYNFNIVRDQLYQSLFPGANDPDRYYEGY